MTTTEKFNGFPVREKCAVALPGSDQHATLTAAAAQWRKWGASDATGDLRIAENTARELEIERDHGLRVAINTRC